MIYNNLVFTTTMKSKILALISALITGGVTLVSSAPQAVDARVVAN